MHFHEQIAAGGHRVRQGDVEQRLGVVDGVGGLVANGFHGEVLEVNKGCSNDGSCKIAFK